MIVAEDISKSFGSRAALRAVSFTVRRGEVLGFLGPNGAGKTTMLRILAGFLRPDRGRARVADHDVVTDSLAARQQLGYLPEQVPLYPEMRVREYLSYRAQLKGLRKERHGAVTAALGQVALSDQAERIIGQLSKGYRQRVGLADALLSQPPVLILDEPTDGLDPLQRREALALIAALGRERAVLLSTHVLPEVEQVCQRVVILDRGKVVASGAPADIARGRADLVDLACRGDRERLLPALQAVPGVAEVVKAEAEPEAGALRLRLRLSQEPGATCERLSRAVLEAGGELRLLCPVRTSLEAVFQALTEEAR